MIIVGIDPGVAGAVAFLDTEAAPESRWHVVDMPVMGDPSELNAGELFDILKKIAPDRAFIELVNAMPVLTDRKTGERRDMPATSAFRFGGMFFSIKATIACAGVRLDKAIAPATWKKAFGLKGSDKEKSRQKALQLFPEARGFLARKKDENRAEAMLIAECGRKIIGVEIARTVPAQPTLFPTAAA